jgi:hypothetical protein
VASDPHGEQIGDDEPDLHEHVDRGRPPGGPPPRPGHVSALVGTARDPLALAESRARHPSSARRGELHSDPTTCTAHGPTSVTRAMCICRGAHP